jgi:hypothetical protein
MNMNHGYIVRTSIDLRKCIFGIRVYNSIQCKHSSSPFKIYQLEKGKTVLMASNVKELKQNLKLMICTDR